MGDDLKANIGDEQVDDNDANVYLFLTSPSSSHATPTPSLDVSVFVVPVWFPSWVNTDERTKIIIWNNPS